jgi:hypothetical protein
LSEFTYDHKPAVRIPYFGIGGEELAVRFRIAPEGDRFRWKSGTKPCLYGLLAEARQQGQVALVEGESDCHILWLHGIPAIGIPGAANGLEERDARHLDGIEVVYVVIERDRGGDTVKQWLITFYDPTSGEVGRRYRRLRFLISVGEAASPPTSPKLPELLRRSERPLRGRIVGRQGWFWDVYVSNRSLISSKATADMDEWRESMTTAWPR